MDKIVVAQESGVLPNPENTLESILVSEQEVVVVTAETSGVVVTGIMGPAGRDGISKLSDMVDVDKTGLIDGAMLVYNSTVAKWEATEKLNKQAIECGEF